MAYRIFDNPYFAQPGLSPEGRTCILIVDENGKPTGKYCFSDARAAEIIARAAEYEARAQQQAQPREEQRAPVLPPRQQERVVQAPAPQEYVPRAPRQNRMVLGVIDGVTYELGRHKTFGLYVTDGVTTVSLPKRMTEDQVTPEIAEELLMRKRMRSPEALAARTPDEEYLYTAGDVARFGLTFPAHISRQADKELYARPLLRDLQMLPAPAGHTYSKVDAARLLDRKDAQAARHVLAIFLRMFERQVEDERNAGTARYDNKRGFNKGDSTAATKLVRYMTGQGFVDQGANGLLMPTKQTVPAGIHQNLSDILSGYLVQVVDIMNEGAARTGKMVRTNPRRRAKSRR